MKHPHLDPDGLWLGRLDRKGVGSGVATLRDGRLIDITTRVAPTVRDVLERDDATGHVAGVSGEPLGPVESPPAELQWLTPCDLQEIKACGVTFTGSMVECVIEESASGDPDRAEGIRKRIAARIGDSLASLVPGSPEAEKAKQLQSIRWQPTATRARADVRTRSEPLRVCRRLVDVSYASISEVSRSA